LQLVGCLQPYDPPVLIDKGPDLLQALTAKSNESHGASRFCDGGGIGAD